MSLVALDTKIFVFFTMFLLAFCYQFFAFLISRFFFVFLFSVFCCLIVVYSFLFLIHWCYSLGTCYISLKFYRVSGLQTKFPSKIFLRFSPQLNFLSDHRKFRHTITINFHAGEPAWNVYRGNAIGTRR